VLLSCSTAHVADADCQSLRVACRLESPQHCRSTAIDPGTFQEGNQHPSVEVRTTSTHVASCGLQMLRQKKKQTLPGPLNGCSKSFDLAPCATCVVDTTNRSTILKHTMCQTAVLSVACRCGGRRSSRTSLDHRAAAADRGSRRSSSSRRPRPSRHSCR
jgi:hypothetical protein